MKTCVSTLLAVTIALMGIPHALCACGCGGLGAPVATEGPDGVCPLCGDDAPDPTSGGRPVTCKCGTCGAIEAIATAPAMAIPSAERDGSVRLPQPSSPSPPAQARMPGTAGGEEPPGHFTGAHCALTILLGHFLL